MTSGLDTRERNQQGERTLAFGSALASRRWKPNSLATADVWPSPRLSEGEDAETANFREARFFEVRWVSYTKQTSVGVDVVLSVHAAAAACRPAADRLGPGYATLAYRGGERASVNLAPGC